MFLDKHRKLFDDQSHGAMNGLKYIYIILKFVIYCYSRILYIYRERCKLYIGIQAYRVYRLTPRDRKDRDRDQGWRRDETVRERPSGGGSGRQAPHPWGRIGILVEGWHCYYPYMCMCMLIYMYIKKENEKNIVLRMQESLRRRGRMGWKWWYRRFGCWKVRTYRSSEGEREGRERKKPDVR